MVVGSLKTELAARSLGPSVGWPLVLHGGYATSRSEFPSVGKRLCAVRAKRRAARSYRQLRPCPSPPLGCGRSPPYLRHGAPWFLARRSYLRPGPTALHCYRAPRREDKLRFSRFSARSRASVAVYDSLTLYPALTASGATTLTDNPNGHPPGRGHRTWNSGN